MKKWYRVFISSTYVDLKEERNQVMQTVLELDCFPAGMESFPATDLEQFEFIKRVIDDCDYYLLIVGGRYGSMNEDGVSYTEMEYDYAVSKGINVIAFLHGSPNEISVRKSDTDKESVEKLQEFRKKVSTGRLVKYWEGVDELPKLVSISLSKAIKDFPEAGWVKGESSDGLIDEKKVQSVLSDFAKDANDILLLGGDGTFLIRPNLQVDTARRKTQVLLNSAHSLNSDRLKELSEKGTEIRLYPDDASKHGLRGAIKLTDSGMSACLFERRGDKFKHQQIDNRHLVDLIYKEFMSLFDEGKNVLIKCVIFDLAGVMFDGNIDEFFREIERICSVSIRNKSKNYLCIDEGLNLGKRDIISFLKDKFDIDLSVDHENKIMKLWNDTWNINEGVRDVGKSLKSNGYKVALASNCDKENADVYELKNYLHIFDKVFMSCEMGVLKPEQEFFNMMLEHLSLQSFECLFIDDHRHNIEAADSLGFHCLLIDRATEDDERKERIMEKFHSLNVKC